jgi:hypothetical protein
VRAPKKATRVKVEKTTVTKGKVEKAYTIRSYWEMRETPGLNRDRRYSKHYKTQGEVLKAAKELALEYGVELRIQLEAFCVGNTQLASVTPSGGRMGRWKFEFDAHM